jgi:hypothetical protein
MEGGSPEDPDAVTAEQLADIDEMLTESSTSESHRSRSSGGSALDDARPGPRAEGAPAAGASARALLRRHGAEVCAVIVGAVSISPLLDFERERENVALTYGGCVAARRCSAASTWCSG